MFLLYEWELLCCLGQAHDNLLDFFGLNIRNSKYSHIFKAIIQRANLNILSFGYTYAMPTYAETMISYYPSN